MNIKILIILLIVFTLAPAIMASEFFTEDGNFLSRNEVIDDDVYQFGNFSEGYGHITGDLVSFSYRMTFEGQIDRSANIVANTIELGGTVGNSARLFAYQIDIYGNIDNNVLALGQEVVVDKSAIIGKDLYCVGDVVFIEGYVKGKIDVTGGSVVISGTVDGDVAIDAEEITIGSKAVIKGDLDYISKDEVYIEDGARIKGKILWDEPEINDNLERFISNISVGLNILLFFMALFMGLFLILIFRNHTRESAEQIQERFGISLAAGLLGLLVFTIGALLLLVFIVSIPVGFFLIGAGLFLFYVSKIYVAIVVGRLLFKVFSSESKIALGWEFILGLLILTILFQIPIFGIIVYIFVMIIGIGGAIAGYFSLCKKYDLAMKNLVSSETQTKNQ